MELFSIRIQRTFQLVSTFKSREERERILYRNFVNVGMEVKEMIKDVLNKRGAK